MPSVWLKLLEGFLEKKIFFNFVNVSSPFHNYLPLEKGEALHLNKLESLSLRDTLCQVWLKLAQWFWRRRWKCEKFTDGRTHGQTDRQTDDGRQAIRKAHLSFQLRWAKNLLNGSEEAAHKKKQTNKLKTGKINRQQMCSKVDRHLLNMCKWRIYKW